MAGRRVTPQAERAIQVINLLTHTKGRFARQPFELRPWQLAILQRLFTERVDGLRQYRTCLLMLPRKNGKSELAAALAIYFLLFDGEQGGEVYSAAADKDQAGLVFHVAAQMIRNDPELETLVEIVDSQKRIVHRPSGSFYRAISAEAYSKHGFNASVVIYDELHAAPNRELWDVLSTSQGARHQPLMMAISTAGYDRHSILWELYAHAQRVAEDPTLDPTFLPLIYEAPIGADWRDEAVWHACNPALGDFRSLEDMRIAAKRAASIPAQENTFRRLYLNQWTEQSERWIDMAAWDACAGPVPWSILREQMRGKSCVAGLDLSSRTDLTACVLFFPEEQVVLPFFWCPEEGAAKRASKDHVPYPEWIRAGLITATPGNVIDQQGVRRDINQLAKDYRLLEMDFDPFEARGISTQLSEQDGLTLVEIRQGFGKMSEPTKDLGALVVGKRLRHGGHPVLRWMAGNMVVEQDPDGNLRPDRSKVTEKIDGIVALIMAIGAALRQQAAPKYDLQIIGR